MTNGPNYMNVYYCVLKCYLGLDPLVAFEVLFCCGFIFQSLVSGSFDVIVHVLKRLPDFF